MKKNPFLLAAALLIIGAVVASIVSYFFFGIDWEERSNESILTADMVDHAIMDQLSEPLTVAHMLSGEDELKTMLQNEWKHTEEEMENMTMDYLGEIQREFGYDLVYLVSAKTKRYYTFLGISKVLDPQEDAYDNWFTDFETEGKEYQVDSSWDQVNRNRLTVFIDRRIDSDIGRFLGVVGVGVETEKLIDTLQELESQYGIRIDFISSDGTVQLSSRTESICNTQITGITLPEIVGDDSVYSEISLVGGYTVVKYVPEVNWYLVIRSNEESDEPLFGIRFLLMEGVILIAGLTLLYFIGRSLKLETSVIRRKDPNIDELTGLPNKDYFIQIYGEKGTIRTIQFQSIAQFAIDDFEAITNPAVADRIVLSVLRIARESFGSRGQIMRWNKGAFIVLLEMAEEEADTVCRRFVKAVEEVGEVTVSVGLTNIDLNSTLKRDYYRSVQNLYLVKELGGNNVKRG